VGAYVVGDGAVVTAGALEGIVVAGTGVVNDLNV